MTTLNRILQFLLNFILLPLSILAFNLYLIYPWFLGSGPANLGSIEVSYVSMAKFLVSNYPNLSWAPFWYLGFPFHLFYTPVLPVLNALLNVLSNLPFWQGYRVLTGSGFVLAPVGLFFLILSLTRNRLAALASAFTYSVIPSIFYFILPSGEVRADTFSQEFYDPRRLVNLVRWGEGPHVFSLIFLPLAGLFFWKTLNEKRPIYVILAAIFIGLTAMTNAIGLYALAVFLIAAVVVRMFFDQESQTEVLGRSLITALFAYGFIAFWYNFSFIGTFFSEGGGVFRNWLNMMPWGLAFLVGGVFILLFLLKKIINDEGFAVVFLWVLSIFGIVATYYLSAPPEVWKERIELAPQALRYTLEVDMGLAAFLGVFIAIVSRKISVKSNFFGRAVNIILSFSVLLTSLAYGFMYAPTARKIVSGQVDLEETAEKKIADYLSKNVDPQKGERVFLAGNYVFYLNYFTDVWQLRGGLYQAKTHPWPEHIYYQLRVGKDPQIAKSWLEIINAKYVVVIPGPEYEEKKKFEVLPLLTTLEDGSMVYKVPLQNTSPAKIVDLNQMNNLRPPKKGDDKEPILAYDKWLNKIGNQSAVFQKINNDVYKVQGTVGEGEGILVQMTYDGGWQAKSTGGTVEIKRDPLGFFVLIPPKNGKQEITLTHGKTVGIWLGYIITLVTVVFAFWYGLLRKKNEKPHE